eukprot:Seg1771.10 transcript_id=Seg1771.10/GoldUCD/mRNA.D3Y31 product="hypothetical protein" protein_id=Seg1771.10/GoldUCD/D3Y31
MAKNRVEMVASLFEENPTGLNFGQCSTNELESLCPGTPFKTKLMYTLVKSTASFINQRKGYQYARALFPICSGGIIEENNDFKIRDIEIEKQLDDLREETQQNIINKFLIMPVVKFAAVGGHKISYWTLAIAILEEEVNKVLFLNPFGDRNAIDPSKMRYFFGKISPNVKRWVILTHAKYQQESKAHLPKAKKAMNTGVICFLYALHIIADLPLPCEVDVDEVRLWIVNQIIMMTMNDYEFDDGDYVDDETQFP